MKKCPACAEEIQDEAKKCRFCGTELEKPFEFPKIGCGGAFIIFVLIALAYNSLNPNANVPATSEAVHDSLGRQVASDVTDDASLLLSRCGRPSSDETTAYDKPRPPIPTRIIEYGKQGLRIAFVPGDGTEVGDPPPYSWKLMGIMDMTGPDPSNARVVSPSEAVSRMPCWGGK